MKKNENIVISVQNGQKWRFWRFINRKAIKINVIMRQYDNARPYRMDTFGRVIICLRTTVHFNICKLKRYDSEILRGFTFCTKCKPIWRVIQLIINMIFKNTLKNHENVNPAYHLLHITSAHYHKSTTTCEAISTLSHQHPPERILSVRAGIIPFFSPIFAPLF